MTRIREEEEVNIDNSECQHPTGTYTFNFIQTHNFEILLHTTTTSTGQIFHTLKFLHSCTNHNLPPTTEEVCFHLCAGVRLSVCKITQKRVHGFGWNVACRQMSGHKRTFEPDPDHSPDARTGFLSAMRQRGILLRRENLMHVLVLAARRSSNAWFWGVETPLSEVNALYRVHF